MTDEREEIAAWDARCLARCDELAASAHAKGNVAVGAVVAVPGRLIAEAEEAVPLGPDPFGHAEIEAVRRALAVCDRETMRAATLYTTVEPCLLCAFAVREAHVRRVMMGKPAGEIGGATSPYPILSAGNIRRWGPPPELVWVARSVTEPPA